MPRFVEPNVLRMTRADIQTALEDKNIDAFVGWAEGFLKLRVSEYESIDEIERALDAFALLRQDYTSLELDYAELTRELLSNMREVESDLDSRSVISRG